MKLDISLPQTIDAELAEVVQEQGVYASPGITKLTVNEERNSVTVDYDGDTSAIESVVQKYLIDLVKRFRRVTKGVIKEISRSDYRALETNVFEQLVERGWAFPLGAGQVGIAGRALDVFEGFDRCFVDIAERVFDAKHQRYPMLMPTDVLHRCNYFSSFPHLVSIVSHFHEDYELLKEVRDANDGAKQATIVSPEHLEIAAAGLTPAVCYHCYHGLEDRELTENSVFTAIGRCARYESTNMVGLDRLWDFSMREIIFVGEEQWVVEQRERSMEAFYELLTELDLNCLFEGAADPFFAPIYANKSYWQSNSGLKFEGRFPVEEKADGSTRTMSCVSFNLHQDFFGKTFNISLKSGEPVHTGCVGIGVDRFVLAYFIQHGLGDHTPLLKGV